MKKYALIVVHVACASALLIVACSNPVKSRLRGNWKSKDGAINLKITEKDFIMDDGDAIPEDYFIKNDTIFTSFEGNQPFTKFAIQTIDDHNLTLMGPDSVAVAYSR